MDDLHPGIPRERKEPTGPAAAITPQRSDYEVLTAPGWKKTAVFGTSCPPRLLSGTLRRLAYKIPEHRAEHWMTLLLADRVDVWEHRPVRLALLVAGLAYLAFRPAPQPRRLARFRPAW